jgi:Cu2+-exporting ATPase
LSRGHARDRRRALRAGWLIERPLTARGGVGASRQPAARRARIAWRDGSSLPSISKGGRIGYTALPLDARALDDSRRRESRAALSACWLRRSARCRR